MNNEAVPVAPGQWRLAEVQVANWGTFDGAIYRIPVSRKGQLITGPSGSGKSSLLDAIATVLTPDRWLRFNLAAQGAGTRSDQRSLMSYVRGAWARRTDEFEDRVVSEYLRPGPTWSGIVMRYENGVDLPVTLARLFFAKGNDTSRENLSSLYVLERAALDLRDLEPFARSGLESRKLQAAFPDALVNSGGKNTRFYQRLRSIFGIADESALQLLHKTQSAKNLDSLNQLFRESMLEKPETFKLAEEARTQFGELNEAHEHVVRLRQQRDLLAGLRDASIEYDLAESRAAAASTLGAHVLLYQRQRQLELAFAERTKIEEHLIVLRADSEYAAAQLRAAEESYDVSRQRTLELGGGDVEQLRLRVESAAAQVESTERRWQQMADRLAKLGIAPAPVNASEFAELVAEGFRSGAAASAESASGPSIKEHDQLAVARHNAQQLEREIDALARSKSSVPEKLQVVRKDLAEHLGVPVTALPFAAELLEVNAQYAAWTGAFERVLKQFALTLLVRSEHLIATRRWVDARSLQLLLVYEEVLPHVQPPKPVSSNSSLVHRVTVKPGAFEAWMHRTLSERFDYACVDQPDQFDDHARAVTINGQIKSSRTRYVKDDRVSIGNRGRWILGDHEAKHEALVELLASARAEVNRYEDIVDAATRQRDFALLREDTLNDLRTRPWAEFDVSSAKTDVDRLHKNLVELTGTNSDLAVAQERLDNSRQARDLANGRVSQLESDRQTAERRLGELAEMIAEIESRRADDGTGLHLTDELRTDLQTRFAAVRRSITLITLAETGQQVSERLYRERDQAKAIADKAGSEITSIATKFRERWRGASADLVANVEGRHGFIELYDGIVANGLPDHESRFFDLLRDRSRDMVGQLVDEIMHAPDEIEARIDPVNASLRRSAFDEARYLHIEVKTKRGEAATRFLQQLRSISENSWADDNAADAEHRFATLSALMQRLDSSDPQDRKWRDLCLDTRLHVTFLAHEIDDSGRRHSTYDSGAAMSGGQQQKLVVFCLAAALRYQLADPDDPLPRYGTIVLDEAFDKADSRYTRLALDVFQEFGFQMVLATPHKLLQTIEPYVGGATEVENPTRARSHVSSLMWENPRGAA
ncbi:uncharacterized protein YPO0396 [Leucobacter exalbidus]|uniref:Uncharacterized protein YPO0396 n=1 Tax=Leucobacter exalbidus TaxID=662960 RepID=A0A940PV58_9MICO|nr:ATP-binding protein [Leucobacter exalbidus]MBP1325806.1 uncharacterized protein YPO0396 [Leucobacter exalbidus]